MPRTVRPSGGQYALAARCTPQRYMIGHKRVPHRGMWGPTIIVAQAGRRKQQAGKQKKRPSKAPSRTPKIEMPRSRDDAVDQAALSLRACYRKALENAPKRGISEDADELGNAVVTTYCICPTNTSELSLSQDIASAMLGSATGTCALVTDGPSREADGDSVSYADATTACDADFYFCVAPTTKEISKVEALVRALEVRGRRGVFLVVVNPGWRSGLGDGDACSVIDSTAYCFFPILIKPLMMQTLEGVVYKTTGHVEDPKPWKVFAGKEPVGQMAVQPNTNDVESILYNAIAAKNKKQGKDSNPFSKLFGGR